MTSDPAVTVRDYVAADFEAVCAVHDRARPLELEGSCDPAAFVPLAEDEGDLENFRHSAGIVAIDGERLVGFAATDGSFLGWLYVDPDDFGRGIGRLLLRSALARTGPDARTIVLAGNDRALSLYESEGFRTAREFEGENAGHECRARELVRGAPLATFDRHWDFDDPAASERRFRALLPLAEVAARAGDPGPDLELRTQIARTLGLRRRFDEAHALLDEVEKQLDAAAPVVRVRYLLERGRTFNSSGEKERARKLFEEAWERARAAGEDAFAVDAAHMMGIVEPTEESIRWNELALALAAASEDERARRWKGSLCNNLGWTYHDAGDFPRALKLFEEALTAREEQGKPNEIRIARWCIARCLRSLGRYDEALAMQEALLVEHEAAGTNDGYVAEELGELLLVLGRGEEARPWFAKAWATLSEDPWLAENEAERLARLKRLAEEEAE